MVSRTTIAVVAVVGVLGMAPPRTLADLVFSPASPVTALNSSASDTLTWISPDGLTAVIASNRLGTNDIFSATRPDVNSAFSAPTTFPFTTANNATFNSDSAVLSADGLELFYHAANSSTARSFFRATRTSTANQFSAGSEVTSVPVAIPGFDPGGFNRPNWLSADGNRLYYRTDFGVMKLATRTLPTVTLTPSAFDPFVNINAGGNAFTATLSPDELTVIFQSSRIGGMGSSDMWYATRTGINNAFGTPLNLASVNTAGGEGNPVWFGDTLYFSRGGDIYSAQLMNEVPEPSSLALLAGGSLALIACRRRKREKGVGLQA